MLTESEAKQMVVGVATAMIQNDKQAREMVYGDLDTEELKRVLRWSVRWMVNSFMIVNVMQGIDPAQAWQDFAMGISSIQNEGEE